jgi:hypothetical protein
VLELEHASAPGMADGLAGVGDGWELTVFALGMHLAGQAVDPTAWSRRPSTAGSWS